jgi:hypothetical protein
MDQFLLSDLDREIEYADTSSVFYGALFRALREIFGAQRDGLPASLAGTLNAIEERWRGREFSAWFERPLLLASAFHRMVLEHSGHRLQRFYATCGGGYEDSQRAQLHDALAHTLGEDGPAYLAVLEAQSLQTNEIARGICWMLPASALMTRFRQPVVLVELGCSAGLNLISDEYGWQVRQGKEPLLETHAEPRLEVQVEWLKEPSTTFLRAALNNMRGRVAWRTGCDLVVPDTQKASDCSMLRSLIWGDNPARLERLEQALSMQVKRRAAGDITLNAGDAIDFVPSVVEEIKRRFGDGVAVIFYNTVVTCYFDAHAYERLKQAIIAAFKGPLHKSPCYWIEHEPVKVRADLAGLGRKFESTVRIHSLDAQGDLSTSIVAGTDMHPRTITLADVPLWKASSD